MKLLFTLIRTLLKMKMQIKNGCIQGWRKKRRQDWDGTIIVTYFVCA